MLANFVTKSMVAKAKAAANSASKIARQAADDATSMAAATTTSKDETTEIHDEADMDVVATEGSTSKDYKAEHQTSTWSKVECILSDAVVRLAQHNDAELQSWIEVARLKSRIETLQESSGKSREQAIRGAQGAHHSALISLRKDVRGFVDHCYINDKGILVIANANKEDPIPVITRSMGKSMIVLSHDEMSTLHSGARKMHHWLIERCWWYGIHVDIKEHVKTCLTCQRMKFTASPGYGYQQMRWWNGPGKMVCIDLVVLTQTHTSSQGSRYIFTILDCFSHYPDAYTLKVAKATDCARCLLKWCSYNGVPQEIRADGGSNLNVSEIFVELYKMLNINSVVNNAYAPQSNTVERFHRWLGAALRILLFKFDLDVDDSIPHILWIWRATICRMTGFTPFAIHCGRAMRFPRDLFERKLAHVTHTEYANHLRELTGTLWTQARNAQRIAQLESARYYNAKHGGKSDIRVGDLILRKKIPTNPTDVPTHMLPRCTGPYRVLKINARGVIIEHATTHKTTKSSLRHIRPCTVRRDDEEYDESGSLRLNSNDYVVIRMYPKASSDTPRWQVAKLLYPTPDEDAWMLQWCNTSDVVPVPRMDRKFKLAWFKNEDSGEEAYAMNAKPGYVSIQHVVLLHRILTPSFRLLAHGRLPPNVKAIIKSKFESRFW
jgi:hypothetical protein